MPLIQPSRTEAGGCLWVELSLVYAVSCRSGRLHNETVSQTNKQISKYFFLSNRSQSKVSKAVYLKGCVMNAHTWSCPQSPVPYNAVYFWMSRPGLRPHSWLTEMEVHISVVIATSRLWLTYSGCDWDFYSLIQELCSTWQMFKSFSTRTVTV